jgi:hypothetical protein
METLAQLRHRGLGWLALPVALVLWASVASANEVSGHGAAPGIVVHDVEETMRDMREMMARSGSCCRIYALELVIDLRSGSRTRATARSIRSIASRWTRRSTV